MAEQQVTGFPTKAAPNSRTTKDSERFELLAVNATFNGSASAAAFLPAVEIVSDSGVVVARHVTGSTVAAGASAEVTFAPFLRGATSSTGPSGETPMFFATMTVEGPTAGELGSANVTHPANNDPTQTPQMFLGVVWTVKLNGKLEITLFNGSAASIEAQLISLFVQRIDVLARESVGGSSVVIAAGTTESIPIEFLGVGAALLNLGATPPTFNAAGVYAVFASIEIFTS